jgi:chalcone isomerase-like protein
MASSQRLLFIFLLIFLPGRAVPVWAAEVAGVKIDDKARVADAELSLMGAGLRKRVIFQVYAIGLYVRDPKADPVSQPGPKRVQIHMLRDVGAEQFIDALSEGIKENHSEAQTKALEPRVKELGATLAAIKEAKKGMTIALDWTGSATQLLVDGKPAGRPIEGEDFYRALLRIWLGDRPVQEDLKKALLGT